MTGSHLCHRQFCPWGPSPGSPARCPDSWGDLMLARCPPHRRPPQNQRLSLADHSGPCHLVRSLWPTKSKRMRNESVISDECEEVVPSNISGLSNIAHTSKTMSLFKTPNEPPAGTLNTLVAVGYAKLRHSKLIHKQPGYRFSIMTPRCRIYNMYTLLQSI